uniref:Uncharacterized protein n=1 Tax=Cyprinus carpio TaxID=7962 RepID=A0A8C2KZB2_CYPCA
MNSPCYSVAMDLGVCQLRNFSISFLSSLLGTETSLVQTPKLLLPVINISASDWPDALWDSHFVGLVTASRGGGLWVASRMQDTAFQGFTSNGERSISQ